MARKAAQRASKSKPAEIEQYCRECVNATWVMQFRHIDIHGKPICLTCPHVSYYILRGNNAKTCTHYRKGTPKVGKKDY